MKKGIEMIRRYRMIEEGDHVIAGVSGGPDSVYLLFLLMQYKKSVPFSISVVHVEHGIRGQESREDAQFVQQLCRKMEIPFFLFEVDAQKEAKTKKISTEEAGRILRYAAFEEACRRYGGNKIAIAHNEDDQAETILWNLSRGSGLAGLCGMQPFRGKLIRPMLTTSRTEIEQWLEENEIETRQDKTNLEEIYTRNKIRHQIIPRLRDGINAQAVRHIAEAGQKIQKAEAFLQKMTDQAQAKCLERSENSARIRIEPFLQQEPIIQEYLIRRAVSEVAAGLKDFTNRHVEALLKIACGAEQGQTNLPGGVTGKKEKGFLILAQAGVRCEKKKNIFIEVPVPGIVQLENGTAEFTFEEMKCQRIPEKSYTKWIDYDTINSRLILRSRLPGDYLIVNKEGGKKKLKDYLIDMKVPREERDSVLLLADGSHILWVVGFRISESCKVKEGTKHILKIKITKENKNGTQD